MQKQLWKEEYFEQGIWTLLYISGWDDGEIWAIGYARYTWRASLWFGNLVLWCRRKKTAVFGLYEELSKEFSESIVRITGILRDSIDLSRMYTYGWAFNRKSKKKKIKPIEFLESWAYYNSKYISLISWWKMCRTYWLLKEDLLSFL